MRGRSIRDVAARLTALDALLRLRWGRKVPDHRGQAERHRRNLGALVAFHEATAERLMGGAA